MVEIYNAITRGYHPKYLELPQSLELERK